MHCKSRRPLAFALDLTNQPTQLAIGCVGAAADHVVAAADAEAVVADVLFVLDEKIHRALAEGLHCFFTSVYCATNQAKAPSWSSKRVLTISVKMVRHTPDTTT